MLLSQNLHTLDIPTTGKGFFEINQQLQNWLDIIAANDDAPQRTDYRHSSEGPDDMPSHIKSMITQTQLAIPIMNGLVDLVHPPHLGFADCSGKC